MLTNKTALVTGASRGIGAAIAKALQKKVHLSSSITTVLKSVQMLLRQKSQRMAAKRQFTAAMYLIIVPVKNGKRHHGDIRSSGYSGQQRRYHTG